MTDKNKLTELINGFTDNIYFAEYKKEIKMHFSLEHPQKKYIYHLEHSAFYNVYFFGKKQDLQKVFGTKNDFMSKKELINLNPNSQNILPITNYYIIKLKEENYYSPNAHKHLKQRLVYHFVGIDDNAKTLPKFTNRTILYYNYGTEYIIFDNYYSIDGLDKNLDKLLFQLMFERYETDKTTDKDFDDPHYLLIDKLYKLKEEKKKVNIKKTIEYLDNVCSHVHPEIKNIFKIEMPIKIYYSNGENKGIYYVKFVDYIRSSNEEMEKFLILNKNISITNIYPLDYKEIKINIRNTTLLCQMEKIKNYYSNDVILFNLNLITNSGEKVPNNLEKLPLMIKVRLEKLDNVNLINNFINLDKSILQEYEKKDNIPITISETTLNAIYDLDDSIDDSLDENEINQENQDTITKDYILLKNEFRNLMNDDEIDFSANPEEFTITEKIISNGDIYKKLITINNKGVKDKLFLDYDPEEELAETILECIVEVYFFNKTKDSAFKVYATNFIRINAGITELKSLLSKIGIFRLFNKNRFKHNDIDSSLPLYTPLELIKKKRKYGYLVLTDTEYLECENISKENQIEKIPIYNIDYYLNLPALESEKVIILDYERRFIKNGVFVEKEKLKNNVIFLSKDQKIRDSYSEQFSDKLTNNSEEFNRESPMTPSNIPIITNNNVFNSPVIKTLNVDKDETLTPTNITNNNQNNSNDIQDKYGHCPGRSVNVNPSTQTEPVTFEDVLETIQDSYNFDKAIGSSTLDIISVYLKGQKTLYIEAKSYCEKHLYSLMLPAIFITTACSVISGIFQDVQIASIVVAGLTAFNSFILALITYLKLDAKAEAHKITAYAFEQLQSECEFYSGKVMFSQMDNDETNDITADEIIKFIIKTEKKVREIREKNQFILPESVRHRFRKLYSANVFSRVKGVQTGELVKINRLKNKINEVLEAKKILREYNNSSLKQEKEDKLNKLKEEQNNLLKEIISYRKEYVDIGDEFDKEILDNIKKRYNLCSCLAT